MTDEQEIVNLDDCPIKPALIPGGFVAFVLTLFPLSYALCCLPLILGGFTATTVFIRKYGVRVELKVGMKIAILACMAGFGASTFVYDVLWDVFDYRIGFEWYIDLLLALSDQAPEATRDELIESIEILREQTFSLAVLVQQFFTVIVTSGIGGAIGGALASSIFKKGAIAQ